MDVYVEHKALFKKTTKKGTIAQIGGKFSKGLSLEVQSWVPHAIMEEAYALFKELTH